MTRPKSAFRAFSGKKATQIWDKEIYEKFVLYYFLIAILLGMVAAVAEMSYNSVWGFLQVSNLFFQFKFLLPQRNNDLTLRQASLLKPL